jgi:hypothetical protein
LLTCYSSQERTNEYFSFAPSDDDRPLTARQDSLESLGDLTPKASNANGESSRGKEPLDSSTDLDATPKSKLLSRESPTKLELKSGAEPSLRNMTVETETVSSIPQATLGPAADRSVSGRNEQGGTLRVKASAETIRPKKEKKKATKKAPSIHAASCKFPFALESRSDLDATFGSPSFSHSQSISP